MSLEKDQQHAYMHTLPAILMLEKRGGMKKGNPGPPKRGLQMLAPSYWLCHHVYLLGGLPKVGLREAHELMDSQWKKQQLEEHPELCMKCPALSPAVLNEVVSVHDP